MPKHYAKKGKTKIDPIFDTLTEIDTQDEAYTEPKLQGLDPETEEPTQ